MLKDGPLLFPTMKFFFGCLVLFICAFAHTAAKPTSLRRDADFESVRTRLDRPYVNTVNEPPNKYFHESSFEQHYDGRFGDRPLKYDEKQANLKALIQTYLLTMNDIGAETWLMHGSLLGWWWNRRIMPWDSDIDVMVSERSLLFLASYHNMTVHRYKLPGQKVTRHYLLEISPHYKEAQVDEDNRIDARWIDTDNGLFIDITTLRRNVSGDFETMYVKDGHHYVYDDIYPLRESAFEGIPVFVPYAYAGILEEEYGDQALSGIKYESHRFDEDIASWIPRRISIFGKQHEDK